MFTIKLWQLFFMPENFYNKIVVENNSSSQKVEEISWNIFYFDF